jgi:hypothetical protein
MSPAYNVIPLLAVTLAEIGAPSGSALAVYGPMGVICAWLMFRDERRAKEGEKLREEIGNVAHQMKGLNRNLLYVTATHGPMPLREIASRELERLSAKD